MQIQMLSGVAESISATPKANARTITVRPLQQPNQSQESSSQRGPEQHLPVLDAWRGVAVVLLMIGHFLPNDVLDCGTLGVEFFFVLSGFLMGRILFVKQTSLDVFYQRRIARIFPAAYTFLLFVFVRSWISTSGASPDLSLSASCLLFYFNYYVALDPAPVALPVGHFWSLCVEEHTYIALSGLSLIQRKRGISPLVLIGAGIAFCWAMAAMIGPQHAWDYHAVYWRSDCRAASILMGALAACLVGSGVGRQARYYGVSSITWGVLTVLTGVVLQAWFVPQFLRFTAGTVCLTTGLLLISQHARGGLWANPVLTWLGTISFSLYLWQQPFHLAVKREQISVLPAIAGSVLFAVVSYHLIEKPARAFLTRKHSPIPTTA